MSLLKFGHDDSSTPRPKKPLKLFLGVGVLVGVIALGSTLAASINLNSGGPIEFGQGVAQTVACDPDGVELTPFSKFNNSEVDAAFYFSSVKVSGVSSNCVDITFKLRAFMNGNSEPLYWPAAPSDNSFEFGFRANLGWTSVSSCMALDSQVSNDPSNNSVTIDWSDCVPGSAALAGQVDRLTLETSKGPNIDVFPIVGSIGEGGGIIVYYNESGFACGPTLSASCQYLEAAPLDWNSGNNDFVWATTDYQEQFVGGSTVARSLTSDGLGDGLANSIAIVAEGNDETTAAGAARAYRGGGKDNWNLPSPSEWYYVADNLNETQLPGGLYWMSSEKQTAPVRAFWGIPSQPGYQNYDRKSGVHTVRPVRAY